MFLRKLTVAAVPLLLLAGVCLLLPLTDGWGFWEPVAQGMLSGAALSLLLPLSGAGRKREPFASLLWIPCILTMLLVLGQGLRQGGASGRLLAAIPPFDERTVLVECLFAGFMLTTCLRTRR